MGRSLVWRFELGWVGSWLAGYFSRSELAFIDS